MADEVEEVSSESSGDTAVTEESTSQVEASAAEQKEEAPEVKQEEKQTPFHEHPRFKELIEQNRAFKDQDSQRSMLLESMQRELQSLRQQMAPKKEEPKDAFLTDLEKVNPEYARSLQAVYQRAAKAEEIEKRLAQFEQASFQEKAVNHFNQLLVTNKITDPMDRKVYERAVRAEVYEREGRGEKLGLKDLDKIVNDFHAEYSKAMEERSRKLTASYVQDKTQDKAPKSTTGGAATAPVAKKMKAGDISGQAKWLADQIRQMKKTV